MILIAHALSFFFLLLLCADICICHPLPSNSQRETTNSMSHVIVVAGLLLTLDHYQPQISLKLHIKYCTLDDKQLHACLCHATIACCMITIILCIHYNNIVNWYWVCTCTFFVRIWQWTTATLQSHLRLQFLGAGASVWNCLYVCYYMHIRVAFADCALHNGTIIVCP